MKKRASAAAVALCLMIGLVAIAAEKEASMTAAASGTFEVTLKPLTAYDDTEGTTAGRMSLDKEFKGGLVATSKGEMLMAGTATKGSAGYVAIETVRGTLNGRKGTFVLQHSGTMNRNVPSLTLTVVPDSGTGELVGLSGRMSIDIHDGKHFYEFDYTITEPM
jgi:hypothetical protein